MSPRQTALPVCGWPGQPILLSLLPLEPGGELLPGLLQLLLLPPPRQPLPLLAAVLHLSPGILRVGTLQDKIPVLRIRIHMFLGLLDPDPDLLFRYLDPDPDPSVIKQK